MSPENEGRKCSPFAKLMLATLFFLASLVVVRFVLELAGVSGNITRNFSSMAALFLAAIFVAAVAPLRGGLQKFVQLPLPALILSAWTVGWVMLFTIISAVFRLERSHFAEKGDYGNWGHLGGHLAGHLEELVAFFVIVLALMAIVHLLWRWPVAVGPGAMLGAVVIMRFWTEAMGVEQWRAAAWSSTVGLLMCGFYLGGVGPRLGLTSARKLLAPSLALGWAWRLWVFIAAVLSAVSPFYKTRFFDPSQGEVAARLARLLVSSVIEGFVAGLLVWGIACWIARATRPQPAEQSSGT